MPTLRWPEFARRHWPLVVGMLAMVLPTLVSMARGPWSLESGVHGPIVVATGLWLIYRRKDAIFEMMEPGAPWLTFLGLAIAVPLYVFGRAFDFHGELFGRFPTRA